MAIVTISQIKHRRGIKGTDPMPQLASAELGWAVDTQELFIGNGTIAEGAPAVGNTEILTEHSDLTALISDYTYAGPFNGASMQTGPGPGSPVSRSQNERLDDVVSVRSFGAVGDGVTDDRDAIHRAIWQHTLEQPSNNRYWTTVYIPAGTYRVTGPIQVPSHVRLIGDGFDSSIIEMDSGNDAVLEIMRMTDPNTLGTVYPEDILIRGVGFDTTQSVSHACTLADANNIVFEYCAFRGSAPDTTVLGNNRACVVFLQSDLPSYNIKFLGCLFTGNQYGIASDIPDVSTTRQDISNVVVEHCTFDNLYKGMVVGVEVDTTTFTFPSYWRVSHSFFDNITREGIHCFQTTKFTSAANHFADVGNLQAATPTYSNIVFGDNGGVNPIDPGLVDLTEYENNYSIGDTFDRTDADDATIRRINSNCLNSYVIDPFQTHYGTLRVEPGRLIRLIDNTAVATSTGVALDADDYEGAIIDYQINRGNDQRRSGTFTLSLGQTTHAFAEDFVELATAIGIVFTATQLGSVTTIEYTLTNEGVDAVFSYSIRHLTCKAAVPV